MSTTKAEDVWVVVPVDGRPSAVVYAGDVLWVADDEGGIVRRLDPDDGGLLGPPITVSPRPAALAGDAEMVWVVDPDGTVTRIDTATATVRGDPLRLGGVLVSVALDGTRAWVGDIEAGTVRPIDGETGEVGPAVSIPAGVVRLEVVEDRLWVSGLERTVTPVDLVTLEVGESIPVGEGPIGMDAADGGLWVANSDAATVSPLTADDGERRGPDIAVGPAPVAVAVAGDDVWVLDQDGPSLTRIDGRDRTVVGPSIDLPHRPRGLAVTPAGVWTVGVDPSTAVLAPRVTPGSS